MFEKLIGKGMPRWVVRLLLEWYIKQECYVEWMGHNSAYVILDDLSKESGKCYTGCYTNGQCENHLFYADDSVIIA